jgi:hypothetical protein
MPDYDDTDRRDDSYDDRGDGDRVIRRAKGLVSGPAIGLLVTGIISLIVVLLNAVQAPTLGAQFGPSGKRWTRTRTCRRTRNSR